jgi:hypothetical protein
VNDFVLDVAIVVLVVSVPAWIVLSLAVVLGRLLRADPARAPRKSLGRREADRLVRRARGRPRTEWGRWRRVAALQRLEQAHHPAAPRLIRPVLDDSD